MAVGMEPFKKDQFEGAVPTIYAATVTRESGQYICAPAIPEAGSDLSRSDELADQLMDLTRKVVMEKTKRESLDQGCPFDDLVLHWQGQIEPCHVRLTLGWLPSDEISCRSD
jgi:hypothetical protein